MQTVNSTIVSALPNDQDLMFNTFVYREPIFLNDVVGAIYQLNSETRSEKILRFWLVIDRSKLVSGYDLFSALYQVLTDILPVYVSEVGVQNEEGPVQRAFFEFRFEHPFQKLMALSFLMNMSSLVCTLDDKCIAAHEFSNQQL